MPVAEGVFEIRYESQLHRTVLDALKARLEMSRRVMSNQYTQWQKNEEQYMAFLPETDNDAIRKDIRESGRPQYTTLEIPYSYAILMTAHTYYSSVFLARNPVFQFSGRHGEPQNQEMA